MSENQEWRPRVVDAGLEQINEDAFTPVPVLSFQPSSLEGPVDQALGPSRQEGGGSEPAMDTISRLAMRFAPTALPTLVMIFPELGQRIELRPEETVVVGRDPRKADVVLLNASVSQRHCQLQIDEEECVLTDLGSSNGTFVNGARVTEPRPLRQGDLVVIGRFVFCFFWYRFAPQARPESLHYADLAGSFARLYPTPSSVQNLLLAANLFSLPVDITRGTIGQIWDRVLATVRRQDVLSVLHTLLSCALHDHPDSSELRRAHETLLVWQAVKQDRAVQERVNVEVKNSALLVEEILRHHAGGTDAREGEQMMMLEDLEPLDEARPAVGLPDARPTVSRVDPTPAELPFELKLEENNALQTPLTLGPPATLTPVKVADHPSGGESLQPLEPPPPPDLRAPEDPGQKWFGAADAVSAAKSPGNEAPESTPPTMSPDTRSLSASPDAPPPPVPTSSRTDVLARTTGELRAPVVTPTAAEEKSPAAPPWEAEKAPARKGWMLVAGGIAAAAMLAGVLLPRLVSSPEPESPAVGVVASGAGTSGGDGLSVQAAPGSAEGEGSASAGLTADAPPAVAEAPPAVADAPPAVAEVPPAVADAPPAVAEVPPAVAEVPPAVATSDPATASAPEPVSATRPDSPAVVPTFEVLNFLNDAGKPTYSSGSLPPGAVWDAKTSQITAGSLLSCVWVESKTSTLPGKPGRTFHWLSCKTSGGQVEGWVVSTGMKRL